MWQASFNANDGGAAGFSKLVLHSNPECKRLQVLTDWSHAKTDQIVRVSKKAATLTDPANETAILTLL